MFTRHVFCAILSLPLLLGFSSLATAQSIPTDAEMPNQQVLEKLSIEELTNQIRRDKFDLILPQVMRENNIDMWIQVMRENIPDPIASDLGSNNGVFIFTDRGVDRIERAVLGHRWKGRSSDLIRKCGAYDIIGEEAYRRELPGGPKTAFDHKFKGIGEFVAERDPKRIGVNYLEKLGPPVISNPLYGISHTDYNLLVKALGDKYAERIVSAEYLIMDYLSRPVKSEIVLLTKIRQEIAEAFERDWDKIVPGVTKIGDLEGNVCIMEPERDSRNDDYVIQRGDLFLISHGTHGNYLMNPDWKYGNFYELSIEYGYVLREGETEPPPKLKKAWADHLKIRKVLEDNIKVGRTAGETYEILKHKLEEAGFINNDRQLYYKDLDPDKTQVALDLHAIGKVFLAPRIGPLGPDWQRDMTLPLYHHFVMEYFTYTALPHTKMQSKYINLWFHDGAIVTERGVEYLSPPPKEIHIIR